MTLCRSSVESITWRNRVAAFLLPWTRLVGGGRLQSLVIKNAIASIVFGCITVACGPWIPSIVSLGSDNDTLAETPHWSDILVGWLTIACWLILFGSWYMILRSKVKQQFDVVSVLLKGPGHWTPLVLPPIAIGASAALRWSGYAWPAFWAAIAPLLIVLFPLILMLAVVFVHFLMGKPVRHFRVGDIHSNRIEVLLALLVCWKCPKVSCPTSDP